MAQSSRVKEGAGGLLVFVLIIIGFVTLKLSGNLTTEEKLANLKKESTEHKSAVTQLEKKLKGLNSTVTSPIILRSGKLDLWVSGVNNAEKTYRELISQNIRLYFQSSSLEKCLNDNSTNSGELETSRIKIMLTELKTLKKRIIDTKRRIDKLKFVVQDLVSWRESFRPSTKKPRVNISSSFNTANNGNWSLEWKQGMTGFDLNKTLGIWNHLEAFENFTFLNSACFKDSYTRSGVQIRIQREWTDAVKNVRSNTTWRLSTAFPSRWVDSSGYYTWQATDYRNWGIMTYNSNSSNYTNVYILSRKKTLNSITLARLRLYANPRPGHTIWNNIYNNTFC